LAPDNLAARVKLGLILLANGQFAEARREAVAILDKSPNNDQAMLLLAETSLNERDIDDAERRLHSLNGEKAGYQLALAGLSLRKKDVAPPKPR
jgi:thioredoxin-like negative regulator of GroEL